jgi:hypothetical protein
MRWMARRSLKRSGRNEQMHWPLMIADKCGGAIIAIFCFASSTRNTF